METDPPRNTDPEDLSKYKLDEYDNEPDKKGPSFEPTHRILSNLLTVVQRMVFSQI